MSKIAQNLKEKIRTGDVFISENIDFSCLLLSEPVMRGLNNAGFVQPSPIQLKAIPLGRCGLDLIVQAKSGTGKTCVFSVVALESINIDTASTQVLVLAPTREIAVQIWEVINSIGSATKGLQCHTFIGGLPIQEDRVKLRKCHIAVGSPGRIKQLIESGVLKTDSIRLFVLDEADKLLEDSFQEQINWIYSTLPENKQILALSATYPEYLADHLTSYMRNPTFLRLNISDPALLGISQYYHTVPYHPMSHVVFEEKTKVLINILSNVSFQQCLVFSNLQTRAQNLADVLSNLGWPTACIAGCLDQKDRNHAMAKLKTYKCRILISTDLTSRGIDADKVNMVINMDVPKDHETYLHRIGRAGRFGSFGIAVTLLSDGQERQYLDLVEKRCNTHILPLPDPLPADLAKPNVPPVFLDDVVSSSVINTEEKMIKFRSDMDLIKGAEPRTDSKNLFEYALVNGDGLQKMDLTETQNGSSFPYALASANKLEIGAASTCNKMENVNCVQTFLCQYDVQSSQENGNCHSAEPTSNNVSKSDFNSNLEKMTKRIEEQKEDGYKKICHEQHKDDNKSFDTSGNNTVEHKKAEIIVMNSMMKHEANYEMRNVEFVSKNVDDSSTSCFPMKKQSTDQYRDSLLDVFVQMTQEKSENVRVQENVSLPGRIIESLELEKHFKYLNFRDMFSQNTDLKILAKCNEFKESHSIPNTMIESVIGEYCSEPKVLTEHEDTDMLRKAVAQLLELLENRMIPMFENRESSNGNVPIFENRESSNGNVPMFENRESSNVNIPMFENRDSNGHADVKEDDLNVTIYKEAEISLKSCKISVFSEETYDNTGMINENMGNTYKAQIVPMVQSSYPMNKKEVVDFNDGKIEDKNSFLKSCENSRKDASNPHEIKSQKMKKKRIGYQHNFAIGHLLEDMQSKSEFDDATSVTSDKEVSKSVAAFQADNLVSDTVPVSDSSVVNKTDSPVHFKSVVNGQDFGNALPSLQHHCKSTDDCKCLLQNNLLNIDKPIETDVLSMPIVEMGEMTQSKLVMSEYTVDSETDSDTSKVSVCPVKESISKVKSSKAKGIQNLNGQKPSHGKKECLQSLSDSRRGEINKNKQMSYSGGVVDSDHGNAWELWRKKYYQWSRQTSEMYEQWQRQITDLYGCHSHLQTPDFYSFKNPSRGYNQSPAESNQNAQIQNQHLSSITNAWGYGPAEVFPSHPRFQQGCMYSRNQYVSPGYMNTSQNYYTVPNRSPLIQQEMASADSMQEAFRLQNSYLKSMSKSKKKPEKSQPRKQFGY